MDSTLLRQMKTEKLLFGNLSKACIHTCPLTGAADHGVSEALYLNDPDQNGVELYCDRPKEQWPHHPDGSLEMFTKQLDLDELLSLTN